MPCHPPPRPHQPKSLLYCVMVIGRESKGHKGVEADPDNSLRGQPARVFKRKQRRAIAFRSLEFLCCLCDTIGMVWTYA